MIVIIIPYFVNVQKLIGKPDFIDIPADMIFADAPISVPFPPKQDPSASDHHKGSTF